MPKERSGHHFGPGKDEKRWPVQTQQGAAMLRLNTICHRAVDVARRPQPIAAIAVAATFAANEALLTIFGIAMTVAVALFLSAVAILLFRAALRVDDPAFERTVYLLKLVSVYGPRVLLARRSRQITEACVA